MTIGQDHHSSKYLAHIGILEHAANMARHNTEGRDDALS